MKVRKLIFNWVQSGNIKDSIGEDFDFYEVGKNGVISIVEHTTNNVFSYTIIRQDDKGNIETFRQFNPNNVEYLN